MVNDATGHATVVTTLYRTAARTHDEEPLSESFTERFLNGRGLRRPLHAEVELLLANHGRVADPAVDGSQAAIDQLTTPGATPRDCAEAGIENPWRAFRCGSVQRVDHADKYTSVRDKYRGQVYALRIFCVMRKLDPLITGRCDHTANANANANANADAGGD